MSDFFRLIVLSANSFGEFGTDSLVCPNLEYAYRVGNDCCQSENVYGYVIVKMMKHTWQVVSESVYGCDYTIYEHNGIVKVKEGRDKIVLVWYTKENEMRSKDTQIAHLILYTNIMQITSSAIDFITFEENSQVAVTFKGGRQYLYACKDMEGFQNDLEDVISEGESVGRFVNRALKAELLTAA